MSVVIRYARVENVAEIAALWERMVWELAPDYQPRKDWWMEMAGKLMATNIYHVLTAVEETTGRMVGFIDGFIYPEPSTGKLHAVGQHFYVEPTQRETSVAGRLYREMLRLAKAENAQVIEFFCFEKDINIWAHKGYAPIRTMMRRALSV